MSDAGRVRPHRSGLSGGWGRVHTATRTPGISVEKHRRAAVLQPVSALLSARGLQQHRLHRCGSLCRYTVRSDHLQWVVMIQIPARRSRIPRLLLYKWTDVSVGFIRTTGSSINTWTTADMKTIRSAITTQRKPSPCLIPVSTVPSL